MSVRVAWQPSPDSDIASYRVERAVSIGGPWTVLTTVAHLIPGPNWDDANAAFFATDPTGSETTYYRVTAIDAQGQQSPTSNPFRSSDAVSGDLPSLINTLTIPVGGISTLLSLGFTTIEVWASDDEAAHWVELTLPTVENPNTRLALVDGCSLYTYYDITDKRIRRYRWRFSANGAQPISKWSSNHDGKVEPVAGVPLSIGIARFMSVDGRPQRKSLIIAVEETQSAGGFTVGSKDTVVVAADETGVVRVPLVQGMRIRVALEGTDIVRTITVPATATFDILQAVSEAPDEFTVQELPPLLIKRTI